MDPNFRSWGGHRAGNGNRRPRAALEYGEYEVGEKMLVYFHQLLYEGEVIRKEVARYGYRRCCRYYIHYVGWHKRWDEWVDSKRLAKQSGENIRLMRDLNSRLKNGFHWRSKHPKKPQNALDWIQSERVSLGQKLGVDIPPSLYLAWVEDRELSLHVGIISCIPTLAFSLEHILMVDFRLHLLREDGQVDQHREIALQNLVHWFDMNSNLLKYDTETETSPEEGVRASTVYGLPFLLRLLFANKTDEGSKLDGERFDELVNLRHFEDLGRLLHYIEANKILLVANQQV